MIPDSCSSPFSFFLNPSEEVFRDYRFMVVFDVILGHNALVVNSLLGKKVDGV